jgi:PPM family protein phosphatase
MRELLHGRNRFPAEAKGDDTVALPSRQSFFAVRSYGLTDTGKVRKSNEDNFLIANMVKALQVDQTSLPQAKVQQSGRQGYLFIVADGMGGHVAGEEASALAIDSVESFVLDTLKWFARGKEQDHDQVLREFQAAILQVNARVLSEAAQRPELHGMGTTLTLAYNLGDELFIAHVGDSRCYLCRSGKLYRLTQDHTLVEDLVRAGSLAPEDVAKHRLRHVITNSVGGHSPEIRVEIHKARLEADDRVLLCSDGLTEMVTDDEIARVLDADCDPESACRRLVQAANDAGGSDNITVVIAHFAAHS